MVDSMGRARQGDETHYISEKRQIYTERFICFSVVRARFIYVSFNRKVYKGYGMSVYKDFLSDLNRGRNPFMLCQVFDENKIDKTQELFVQQKMDGARYCLIVDKNGVRLIGRNSLKDKSYKYPEIIKEAKSLWETGSLKDCILDGEIVVQGKKDIMIKALGLADTHWIFTDFNALQSREHTETPGTIVLLTETTPVMFVVFEYISVITYETGLLPGRISEHMTFINTAHVMFDKAKELYEEASSLGLEGIVIKKNLNTYEVGRRSWYWQKWKAKKEVDAHILGYTTKIRQVSAILTDKGKCNVAQRIWDDTILKQAVDHTEDHNGETYHIFSEQKLVAVCSCLELTKNNIMRFPVLKEVRE
jgi:ATP-dependent DNA ligase